MRVRLPPPDPVRHRMWQVIPCPSDIVVSECAKDMETSLLFHRVHAQCGALFPHMQACQYIRSTTYERRF
jgi:hypothetical protein